MDPAIVSALIAAAGAIVVALIGAGWIRRRGRGQLQILDLIAAEDEDANTCTLDFRVQNTGTAILVINRVSFHAIDVQSAATWGVLESSKTYDLDLSDLGLGESLDAPVAHNVLPGEPDRFEIRLVAANLGNGVFRRWTLEPTLRTSVGDSVGPRVEVSLPHSVPDELFEETRQEVLEELKELEDTRQWLLEKSKAGIQTLRGGSVEEAMRGVEDREREIRRFGWAGSSETASADMPPT